MDFKSLFAKELEAGTSVDDILRSVANAANTYEEEQKKNEQKDNKWQAAANVVSSLLDYIDKYTDLDVDLNEHDIDIVVEKFIVLMESVKIFKLW